jgi:hypothetical protein
MNYLEENLIRNRESPASCRFELTPLFKPLEVLDRDLISAFFTYFKKIKPPTGEQ